MIGSSGFLGRVITERLQAVEHVVPTHFQNPIFADSFRLDLLTDDLEPVFETFSIETVIHCAGIEQQAETGAVERAMRRLLAHCSSKRFVYLSSDAIFAGDRGLYQEDETPEPLTHYGRNLLHCETLVRDHCPDHLILRPSYIYGVSRGELDHRLTRTLNAVRANETVSLFEDMYKSPLGVQQVAEAVAALSRDTVTGTLHVAGPRLSVLEFHREAMRALGYDPLTLVGVAMPIASELQRDTSLDTSKWQRLSGMHVLSVAQTLQPISKS